LVCEILIHRGFIGGWHDGARTVRDEERPVVRKKKFVRKRGQEQEKGIWTAVKDNAALVAAIIGLFGVVITGAINTYIANQNQVAQRKLEAVNAQRQRELEDDKAQEAALQTYLTDIGDLILDDSSPLPEATAGDNVSKLARAKTLTVLLGLGGGRKRILLQFLKEEELINAPNPIVGLSGADLSYAQLSSVDKDHNRFILEGTQLAGANLFAAKMQFAALAKADLREADLTEANLNRADLNSAKLNAAFLEASKLNGTNLSRANLSRADLSNARLHCFVVEETPSQSFKVCADLSAANLSAANLGGANLGGANLSGAYLSGAYLSDAYLSNANLSNANLSGAILSGAILSNAFLGDANLTGARGVTKEALEREDTFLKNATMPNGQKYEE
jgi:uncharacterized protein YjbI with pentapeptide repeats